MKKSEKEYYLSCFPRCPVEQLEKLKGKYAANFAVFQAHENNLFIHCYHRFYRGNLEERQRYVFTPSGVCRYGFENGIWKIMSNFKEPVFTYSPMYRTDNFVYTVINKDAVKSTFLKYSAVEYFKEWNIIEYLKFYIRHPAAEHLIKNGFKFANFEGWDLDWHASSLHSALKLSHGDTRALVRSGHQKDISEFADMRKKYPAESADNLLKVIDVAGYRYGTLEKVIRLTELDILSLCRYLTKHNINFYDYDDYINQCRQLKLNLNDKSVNRPRNFDLIHDKYTSMIKINQTRHLDDKIAERFTALQKLVIDYKDLTIVIPQSAADIQREGAILSHCVGSYAERHANMKLSILFLRRKDALKQPYYTIEISNSGHIVQCRGYKNNVVSAGGKPKPPEILEFEAVYQDFLDGIFNKKIRTA